MGQTVAEKVLARASNVDSVSPGDIVEAEPDLYMSHVASWRCIDTLERLGMNEIAHPDRVAMVMDHISPAGTEKIADDHRRCREFAKEHDIETFYDVNAGISHTVLMGDGLIRPGMLAIGTDSHTTIYGALGACGTGVGYSDITATWVTGELWFKVPETLRVEIEGEVDDGVTSKDLMLYIIGKLGTAGANYMAVEFGGSYISNATIADRMTMCNLGKEMGAMFAIVPADTRTREFLASRGVTPENYDEVHPDEDASYARVETIDANKFEPQIARPHTVDNVVPIERAAGTNVDQVFIGSCANGSYADLAEAAEILDGRTIHPDIRMIVTPASKQVLEKAVDRGVVSTFVSSGAMVTNPGCSACAGDGGAMADGEVTLSTANRNYRGRMGSYDAEIYLSSPATAAATAVEGVITDPRDLSPLVEDGTYTDIDAEARNL